jgi:hypothetical protein
MADNEKIVVQPTDALSGAGMASEADMYLSPGETGEKPQVLTPTKDSLDQLN